MADVLTVWQDLWQVLGSKHGTQSGLSEQPRWPGCVFYVHYGHGSIRHTVVDDSVHCNRHRVLRQDLLATHTPLSQSLESLHVRHLVTFMLLQPCMNTFNDDDDDKNEDDDDEITHTHNHTHCFNGHFPSKSRLAGFSLILHLRSSLSWAFSRNSHKILYIFPWWWYSKRWWWWWEWWYITIIKLNL